MSDVASASACGSCAKASESAPAPVSMSSAAASAEAADEKIVSHAVPLAARPLPARSRLATL